MRSQTKSCAGVLTNLVCAASAVMISAGCQFESEGDGMPMPGLGCNRDLRPKQISVGTTPFDEPIGGFADTIEEDFVVADQPFAVNWRWVYNGHFGDVEPSPAPDTYLTHIEIRDDDEVIWETHVVLDSPQVNTGGWESAIVPDGLPEGHYTVVVDVDSEHVVPDCDLAWTSVNNDIKMNFAVWDENGPPQTPTPCQEAEIRTCRD